MKNSLLIILLYLLFLINIPVLAFSSTNNEIVSKIENNLYGFEYSNESDDHRLERIEKFLYGKIKTGNNNIRIKNISSDLSADVIGSEIKPSEDTFLNEENTIVEDSSVNYPIVNEIEQKLFNKTFKDRDFHTRIVTIEKKMFGKVYDVDDYSTRLDRIKAELMPESVDNIHKFKNEYRDNRLTSRDLNGSDLNRFRNPFGQRNYTRHYSNYGEYSGDITGSASPIETSNKNLDEELSQLEMETFGSEFSNEDSISRIKRLNSVNNAKKSASKYDSNKFSQRMSTAMEIGAMILMILAMVL